jgi:preprotein translocase subunit SecE
MASPVEFLQQVRTEASKVVWPARRETLITTALVLAMAVLASVFFLVVDWSLQELVSLVLGFGRTR